MKSLTPSFGHWRAEFGDYRKGWSNH
jgi:hypothetical protein